jgi:predicted small integral membrane protein
MNWKYVRWANAILWGIILLTTCIQAVWEHGLPEVSPFTGFMYLVAAAAFSLAALAGEKP